MKKLNLVKVEWSKHRLELKDKIERLGINANDPNLFTSIDKACSNEWAFLFLASDGFVILKPKYKRSIISVEVTAAYCDGGNALNKYQPNIVKLAKMTSAKFIQFYTIRKGFLKVGPQLGWSLFGYHRKLAIWRYYL